LASYLLLSFPSGVCSRLPAGSPPASSPPSPPGSPSVSPPPSPPASDDGSDGPSGRASDADSGPWASSCCDCDALEGSPSPGRSPRACTNALGHFWTASIDHCGLEGCSASLCEVPECLLVWPCICILGRRVADPQARPFRPRLRCGCEHIYDDSVRQRCINAAAPHGHLCFNCCQGSNCVCLCRGCVEHDYTTERGWATARLRGGGPKGLPADAGSGDLSPALPSLPFPPFFVFSCLCSLFPFS
jgi:hypothetical protein